MLGVGEKFPHFSLVANVSGFERRAFQTITDQDFPGKWKVYFFWPKDFTPLSLDEIIDFARWGLSFGSVKRKCWDAASNPNWRTLPGASRQRHSANSAANVSDIKRDLCGQLGIVNESQGVAQRATFIVDPRRVIRFVYVTETNISLDPGEVLRVLVDLQDFSFPMKDQGAAPRPDADYLVSLPTPVKAGGC